MRFVIFLFPWGDILVRYRSRQWLRLDIAGDDLCLQHKFRPCDRAGNFRLPINQSDVQIIGWSFKWEREYQSIGETIW